MTKISKSASIFILLLWGAMIYANTLHNPFVFDDKPNIEDNVLIRMDRLDANELFAAAFQTNKAGREGSSSRRPVGNLSFALNYYVHHNAVPGYHIVNIAIHCLSACLLYLLILKTLNLMGNQMIRGIPPQWIALLSAMLWLVHPLNTQSVTYIVQRYNSLAALFFLTSLLLYINGRTTSASGGKRWGWFIGAGVAGLLSLGAKANAATLPFFIFLHEWFFFHDLDGKWLKQHIRFIPLVVAMFLVITLVYLGRHPMEKLTGITDFADGKFTMGERLLTEPRVVLRYIALFFFPYQRWLNLDYDFPLSHSILNPPGTLLAVAAILAALCFAFFIAKTHRLMAFCIFWFLGNLVIESSVIPVAIIFEHRTYLPGMMLAVVPVWLMLQYIQNRWVSVTVLSAVVLIFSMWTYQHNQVWRDKVRLWSDVVAKSPDKARPHVRLGEALVEKNQTSDAIAHYKKAILLEPDNEMAHNNLGYALAQKGETTEAVAHYQKAIKSRADFATPHNNLGVLMFTSGRIEDAIKHYQDAINIAPHYCDAKNNLASAFVAKGRIKEAIPLFKAGIDLCPDKSTAYAGLYGAFRLSSNHTAAQETYAQLQQMDADLAVEIKTAMDKLVVKQ
ncbi:MAG: tetratricopeptide repeat protein [Thermodesulfobacteriota bacterium]|nr:tetratricopeptide repeat protein [Thermodesulfobacteriota bacterium]